MKVMRTRNSANKNKFDSNILQDSLNCSQV